MKRSSFITLTLSAILATLLTAGDTAYAGFITRFINTTNTPVSCDIWVARGLGPDLFGSEVKVKDSFQINSGQTKDFDLGAGCQNRINCTFRYEVQYMNWNMLLDSHNLGPQCWSRNIYMHEDSKNKKFYWDWTPFH